MASSIVSPATSLDITKSPDTFNVVLHISRNRSTPRIKPIPSGGTPTCTHKMAIRGKDPPGTPAVPTPAKTDMSTTTSWFSKERLRPYTWARKRTTTPSKSAVPFWLAEAPQVNTKREILAGILRVLSATSSATGRVALEEAVEKAYTYTSLQPWKNFQGLVLAKTFRQRA